VLGHEVQENVLLENPSNHDHKQWQVEVAINDEVGFKRNKETETYELVAELDAWDLDVPVNRFIEKLTQQYAKVTIEAAIEEKGFTIESESTKINNDIELVVSRWT
tara:strand:- start:369 stop:686 length:318 start_codon:yes stop_codon:yes gene_type:complete